jgi:hypothetical protein
MIVRRSNILIGSRGNGPKCTYGIRTTKRRDLVTTRMVRDMD